MSNLAGELALRRKFYFYQRAAKVGNIIRALNPVLWLEMRETSGDIAVNSAYTGGIQSPINTNFEFDDDGTGFSAQVTGDATISFAAGEATLTRPTSGVCNLRQTGLTAGDTYRATIVVNSITGTWRAVNNTSSVVYQTFTTPGTYIFNFISEDDRIGFAWLSGPTPSEVVLESFKVEQVGELDALITSATVGQTGKLGPNHAYDFDGVDDLLTVTNRASIQELPEFSLWGLFKPRSDGEGTLGTMFNKTEYEFRLGPTNRLVSTVSYDTTNAVSISNTTDTYTPNEWNSFGMRINDTSKTAEIFINGLAVGNYSTQTAGVGTRNNGSNDLIIGNNAAASRTFDGLKDEVFKVNRALTDAEFANLHTASGLPLGSSAA